MDRTKRLSSYLKSNDEALLLTNNSNVYYYSYFNNSEGFMIITKEESYLLVDFRYYEAALKYCKNCKVVMFSNLYNSIKEIINKHNIKSIYLEVKTTTINQYNNFVNYLKESGVSFVIDGSLDKIISNQRMIKDKEEIDFIDKAQKITEKSYIEVLNYIKPGVKEKDISNELEYLLKKNGAEDISFDLITITGKNTSLPHGVPGDTTISSGDFFTFDIGAIYMGYHSDMTRTIAVKSYNDKMKEIYDIVLKAQTTALESVTSGVKSCFIDKIARDIIEDNGYGDCFGHSTGHGVGLDIHELPNVSPSGDFLLVDSMIITVEPGIYIKNQFGVRIEDMILVQNTGYYNFASISKELIVV